MSVRQHLAAASMFVLLPLSAAHAAPTLPDSVRAGLARLKQGDAQGAFDHFRAVTSWEPENLGAECALLLSLDRLGLDEEDGRTADFEARLDRFLAHVSSRHDQNASDREALFYVAQAYRMRAAYRFEHGKGIWGAARDAAKAKRFSDDYVKLVPADADGSYTLGLYNYYVALAPSFVKVLSVLLFLPSGNRADGLKQIERAAQAGEVFGQEAQFNLIDIYSEFEARPDDAVRLAVDLKRAYPDNPKVLLTLAETEAHPAVEDYQAAAADYADIVKRARAHAPNFRDSHLYSATTGLAAAYQQQWRLEDAIATLTPVIDANVAKPVWVAPAYLLRRGVYRLQLNDRHGTEDLQRILNEKRFERWQKSARRQMKTFDERAASGQATVYAALIPGNRMVSERRWSEADAFYAQAERRYPDDAQVRYRTALLDFERDRLDRAAEQFSQIIASATKATPTWVKGAAMLYRARIHDLWGQRQPAVDLYKQIVKEFDEADSVVRTAKIGLISPYRKAAQARETQRISPATEPATSQN